MHGEANETNRSVFDSPPRERIRRCCEQLRALVPAARGRKNDAASVLEATVDYVKCVRAELPPAALGQVSRPHAPLGACGQCFRLRLSVFLSASLEMYVFVFMKKSL